MGYAVKLQKETTPKAIKIVDGYMISNYDYGSTSYTMPLPTDKSSTLAVLMGSIGTTGVNYYSYHGENPLNITISGNYSYAFYPTYVKLTWYGGSWTRFYLSVYAYIGFDVNQGFVL